MGGRRDGAVGRLLGGSQVAVEQRAGRLCVAVGLTRAAPYGTARVCRSACNGADLVLASPLPDRV